MCTPLRGIRGNRPTILNYKNATYTLNKRSQVLEVRKERRGRCGRVMDRVFGEDGGVNQIQPQAGIREHTVMPK